MDAPSGPLSPSPPGHRENQVRYVKASFTRTQVWESSTHNAPGLNSSHTTGRLFLFAQGTSWECAGQDCQSQVTEEEAKPWRRGDGERSRLSNQGTSSVLPCPPCRGIASCTLKLEGALGTVLWLHFFVIQGGPGTQSGLRDSKLLRDT